MNAQTPMSECLFRVVWARYRNYLLSALFVLAPLFATAQGTAPLELVGVQSSKILYDVGEPITGTVTVKNADTLPHAVTVRAWLAWHLDDRTPMREMTLNVLPGNTATATFTWAKVKEQFGYAFKAQLLEGNRQLGAGEDYFQISDHYWKTALITGIGSMAQAGSLDIAADARKVLADYRKAYYNGYEAEFWAPDEVVTMAPDMDNWYSSVGHYYESRAGTKSFIAEGHRQGIKAIVYERYSGGGSAGAEWARRHPEWMQQTNGVLAIDRQIQQIAEWDGEKPGNFRGWLEVRENLSIPAVLEHSVQELLKSSEEYGWDGARWDGTYKEPVEWTSYDGKVDVKLTPEQAEVKNALNFRRYKNVIGQKFPKFVYASNWGGIDASMLSNPRETSELCRDGGLVMNEWIRGSAQPQEPLYRWEDYARYLAEDTERARQLGGYYGPILDIGRGVSADDQHKCIFALAAGAHPYYSILWGDFCTRYSYYLWDPALTRIAIPEPLVTAPDSVWWKRWVFERQLSGSHKQLIIHLLNPPTHPCVGEGATAEDLPKPLQELTVQLLPALTARWTPVRATRLIPSPLRQQALPLQDAGGGVMTLTVPELTMWNVLVIDLESRKGGK